MIDMSKDLIILSAELESATFSGNRQRTENLRKCLEECGMEFAEAKGYYNGTEETSFVVVLDTSTNYDYETVRDFGLKSFHQESVLFQKGGESYLVVNDDNTVETMQYVGVLQQVNPKETEGLDNFTIVNNRVFTTKKS